MTEIKKLGIIIKRLDKNSELYYSYSRKLKKAIIKVSKEIQNEERFL